MSDFHLVILANFKMTYGKYKDHYLLFIPESYIIWMINHGNMNESIRTKFLMMKEIKENGLEYLLLPLLKEKQK